MIIEDRLYLYFLILRLNKVGSPDLKGKAGCWCLVKDVHEFSCTVTAWDGEYTLRVDHLKSLNYLDTECNFVQLLHERITSILVCGDLEQAALLALK